VANDLDENVGRHANVLKAVLIGADKGVQTSNTMQGVDEAERAFSQAGAIEPPYSLSTLALLMEHSNSLRQNIDAYVTNIDAFGHQFVPVIDLDTADADQRIAQAVYLERLREREKPGAPADVVGRQLMPTSEEVAQRKAELVQQMRAEKTRLEHFFEFCVEDTSFVTLRRRVRQDLELMGNGYMEVLRDGAGEIAEFVYMPAFTIRLLPLDKTYTSVQAKAKVSDIAYDVTTKDRLFRRFVQVFESRTMFFKEFGDPRVVSKLNGRVWPSVEEMRKANPTDGPATEVLHFKLHSSRTAYGVPRWIGNLLAVLGSRQAEEVNYLYFDNKSVPPLALLVSGGRVTEETVQRLESFVQHELKGKANFHKILILEAEGGSSGTLEHSGKMQLTLQPLTDAQQKDALFTGYDERNMDKVGQSFRLPRLLRGDVRDFNRATADAAIDFAEQQVFQPEREEFDFIINRKVFTDMGVRFWKFQSNSPTVRDPQLLAGIIKDLANANILTPEEGRQLAELVFNRELRRIDAAWVKQPVQLTMAGVGVVEEPPPPFTGEAPGIGQERAPFQDLGLAPQPAPGAQTPPTAAPTKGLNGTLQPAQRAALLRLPPGLRGLGEQAKAMLALRRALIEEEAAQAAEDFRKRRIEEMERAPNQTSHDDTTH
jgi:PBSX family phage portal protein